MIGERRKERTKNEEKERGVERPWYRGERQR